MDSNPVRLRLITHNARLVDARRAAGWTQQDFAKITDLKIKYIQDIENLRIIPRDGHMGEISDALNLPKDYLFPPFLMEAIQEGVFGQRVTELEEPKIISLTEARRAGLLPEGNAEDEAIEAADQTLLKERIPELLEKLAPRERKVIELRFGFDGEGCKTYEQVGQEFGVTHGRIRQIEHKALRKLRHPSRARQLKDFL